VLAASIIRAMTAIVALMVEAVSTSETLANFIEEQSTTNKNRD
jgi:hypothetical protein